MRTSEEVSGLVAVAMIASRLPQINDWASGILIPPQRQPRRRGYGVQPNEPLDCWIIGRLTGDTHALAFSDHGPAGTWGIVRLADDWIGADDAWFSHIEDAFVAAGWPGTLPDDYEVF